MQESSTLDLRGRTGPRLAPAAASIARLDPGSSDLSALTDLIRGGARAGSELFDGTHAHLDELIPKPWGMECRVYADPLIDAWWLQIEPGQGTSMHVHPRKLTYLLCLAGEGFTAGLAGEHPIITGSLVRIAAGAFHSTRNTGPDPLILIEMEAPRNKLDLIRYSDAYHRAGTGYETESAPGTSALLPVLHLPGAVLRDTAPDARTGLEIRAGMDIFYRRRTADLFHVPLGVRGVVAQDLEILPGDVSGGRPASDEYYLTISRAA